MQATSSKLGANRSGIGVVYRTVCQNPGCGYRFDLRITPETVGMLSGPIACPQCHRHGGMLRSQGRIGDKLFAAKLVFRMTGVAESRQDDDESTGSRRQHY
jgi:hypothetical protein